MKAKQWSSAWITPLLLVLLLLGAFSTAAPAQVSPEDVQRIEAALPDKPTVSPEKPRRVLIFTLCKGFAHGSIPYCTRALTLLGERTGAYQAVAGDDVALFRPESLEQFDAIIFNNTTGTLFEDPILKASLLDFVNGGGGVVGIHAATDCFYDWPEFGEMMGAYFHGHPWHEKIAIKLDDPGHPINAAFGGKPFTITDEIYQFKDPYSRDRLHVLLSLDTQRTDMNKEGIHRDDGDFAVSWVRSFGKGRVFYCSLGHRNEIFWNPVVLQHYLDGIQFAIGDLPADARPSAFAEAGAGEPTTFEEALRDAAFYDYGRSRMALSLIAEEVRLALVEDQSRRPRVVRELVALLQSGSATIACRSFVCRQLALIGGEESVGALAALLPDEKLSHMARYALERIPGKAASAALREALDMLDGELRIGVINSLGRRCDRESVDALLSIDVGEDEAMQAAVAMALARIGGTRAVDALLRFAAGEERQLGARWNRRLVQEALLVAAENMAAEGATSDAIAVYKTMFGEGRPPHIRIAALRGLALAAPVDTVPLVLTALSHEDPLWHGTAARLVQEMPGRDVIEHVSRRFAGLTPQAQARLLDALALRGDPAALPIVKSGVESADQPVTRAAIRAMAVIGDDSCVPLLAELAAGGDETARDSLQNMRSAGVDAAIASVMRSGPPNVRIELARALGERGAVGEAGALIAAAGTDQNRQVRLAAMQSLQRVAGRDHLLDLIQIALHADGAEERTAAEEALAAVCLRIDDRDACVQPVISAYDGADIESQVSLLRVLGRVGGDSAREIVRDAQRRGQTMQVRNAALQALADWPDASVFDALFNIAMFANVHRQHAAAFQGLVRIAALPSDRAPEETAAMYKKVLLAAMSLEERGMAIKGLAEVPHINALRMAEKYLYQGPLRSDSAVAVVSIARFIGDDQPQQAIAAINRVMRANPEDEELLRAAAEALNHVQRNEDFITEWMLAGPYMRANTGGGALFDIAFPPEIFDAPGWPGLWREPDGSVIVKPGIVDLAQAIGGGDRCAYLLARLSSDRRYTARLEIGSDDGVKVWLNGSVVHANNVMRGLTLGQDVVEVTLDEGENTLVLKIMQGGGDWRASCRIRSADGFHLEGVSIDVPR